MPFRPYLKSPVFVSGCGMQTGAGAVFNGKQNV